jgi:tRNA 2-thiocytidine biosynthesis protein TtcA
VETLYQVRPKDGGKFRFGSKLEEKLSRSVGRCMVDFGLVEQGDKVMVCVSGGKDSYALLDLMKLQQRRAPVDFELVAVNVDQGWPGYDTAAIEGHLATRDVPYRMITADYARIVEEKLQPGQTPCMLCSRFRRGFLYNLAQEMGCTKIALGHHADDLLETLLMNLFFTGRLGSMPPRLTSDDGRNTVIRPMAYVFESELVEYAAQRSYPVVRCGCPSCGLPEQQRQVTKRLLTSLENEHPGLKYRMLGAIGNVRPSMLLDRDLLASIAAGLPTAGTDATIVRSGEGHTPDEVRLRKLQDPLLHRGRAAVSQDPQDTLQDL